MERLSHWLGCWRCYDHRRVLSIHLRNLASFVAGLEKSTVEVSEEEVSGTEEIVKPRSQEEENFIRVALKSLEQRGIAYNTLDVVVLDLDEKRFWIGREVYEDVENIVFSFEFDLEKGSATKVSVETSLGSKEISGTYALANLLEAVKGAGGG